MEKRFKMGVVAPKFSELLSAIDHYVAASGLPPAQIDLLKIRASQLNGCAYCIQSHTREARARGETEKRIYALDAWEESPYFTDDERAILALTEEMTLIRDRRVSDVTYQQAIERFGEQATAHLMMAMISINAWNRIGIATRMQPA